MKRLIACGAALSLLLPLVGGAVSAAPSKSKNVRRIARVPYKGGSHLAFLGRYAFGGELNGEHGRNEPGFEDKGGVRIFDLKGKRPLQVGYFHCPGNDLDPAPVKRGLIAVGYHSAACTEPGDGLFTLDVSNPRKPRLLGFVTFPITQRNHALTAYPGEPLVYASGGGLSTRQETVSIVDVSNPRKPEIVSTFYGPPRGCHDLSFHFDERGKFAVCSGLGAVQIWDVSDPLHPSIVSDVVNPFIQFAHYSEISPDGQFLVINDENITANECVEQETPTGAIWVYDVSNIQFPQFVSYFSPRRGRTGSPFGSFWFGDGTCTSHDFNFANDRTVVVPFYTGGFSVISIEDPSAPEEIAHYQPGGTDMWSAHWYRGRIYTNDMGRGFEALKVRGL